MLDVVGTQTDDTCITSLERNLISLMEDSLSIFNISLKEWQNYQPCIENSEITSLHYEIIEDILDFVKHPREPEVPAALRVLPLENQQPDLEGTHFILHNNPGTGTFIINWKVVEPTEEFYIVQVFDAIGKNILHRKVKIEDGTVTIQLEDFKAGIYLLKINNDEDSSIETALKLFKL